MGIVAFAKSEMERANFAPDDANVIAEALDKFLDSYDSGGIVWAVTSYMRQMKTFKEFETSDDPDVGTARDVMRMLNNHFGEERIAKTVDTFIALLAYSPLTPLTGEDDEWMEVGEGAYQNVRMATVFKDPRFHDGKLAFDLDNPKGSREAITFPYFRDKAAPSSPVVVFETKAA